MEASIQLHAQANLPLVKESCPLQFSNRVRNWVCPRVDVQTLEKTKESSLPGIELRCQLLHYDSRSSYKTHVKRITLWAKLN
jgi:hypothetical protein